MTSTPTATRFLALAGTLTRNAAILAAAGLPETVVATRVTVYRDVARQLRLLAADEVALAEVGPLAKPVPEAEAAVAVTRRLEWLAGLLAANARRAERAGEAGLLARAGVYRDVVGQVRLWAEDARYAAWRARTTRPTTTTLSAPRPDPVAVRAAAWVAPRVRTSFVERLVPAIAKRRGWGWSVTRTARWLRTALRDPQIPDRVHPCAERGFVAYVIRLLDAARPAAA